MARAFANVSMMYRRLTKALDNDGPFVWLPMMIRLMTTAVDNDGTMIHLRHQHPPISVFCSHGLPMPQCRRHHHLNRTDQAFASFSFEVKTFPSLQDNK